MVTQNEADTWLGQQVGQHLDYDQQYGQQCFDFFNYYYQYITGDNPYADGFGVAGAKDIYWIPTDFFDKIGDSPSLVPNVGDVLVYGSNWGAGYGHVEICRWSDNLGCHVVGENEHGDTSEGVIEVYRKWANMSGLIGVMRPRFVPEPQPIQETPSEPQPTPQPVPTPPSEPQTETPAPTPDPSPSPAEEPKPRPTPDPAPAVPTPPVKVIVPEPTYFKIWELIIAIFQKIFTKK